MSNQKYKNTLSKLLWIIATLAFASLCLHGCKVPGMHQPTIEQGNIVTQKMVDRLRPKMTKAQVQFVLGKPVYQNTFDINRWDYVYTFERQTEERVRRLVTLTFENEELVGISGDYRPSGDAADDFDLLNETPEDTDDGVQDIAKQDESESESGGKDAEEEVDTDD